MPRYPFDPANTDDYIAQFPEATQVKLQEIRAIIQAAAPMAKECISYKMPAFEWKGIVVYFAGYKSHVGFYPTGDGIAAFQHEFGPYKWSKGAVQFPLNEPLPTDLITRIVQYRLERNDAKALAKGKK